MRLDERGQLATCGCDVGLARRLALINELLPKRGDRADAGAIAA
jgi:hypothetical protein